MHKHMCAHSKSYQLERQAPCCQRGQGKCIEWNKACLHCNADHGGGGTLACTPSAPGRAAHAGGKAAVSGRAHYHRQACCTPAGCSPVGLEEDAGLLVGPCKFGSSALAQEEEKGSSGDNCLSFIAG